MQSDFFLLVAAPLPLPLFLAYFQRKDCIRLPLVAMAFLFSPQFGMAGWKRERKREDELKKNNERSLRWPSREIENLISYKFWGRERERGIVSSLRVSSFKLVISVKLPQLHPSGRASFSHFALSLSSPYVFHLVRPPPRYRLDLNVKNRPWTLH